MHPFKGKMKVLIASVLLISFMGGLNAAIADNNAAHNLPGPGDVLGQFSLSVPDNLVYASYLTLKEGSHFRPAELRVDLWLIEVFNVYCASCMSIRPYMNDLFKRIEADSDLKGHVKMVAVGAGNQVWDIKAAEIEYDFPILPDETYAFHNMVGQPPTPFLIFARPYDRDKLVVVDTQLGRFSDSPPMLDKVRNALTIDVSKMKTRPFEGPVMDVNAQAPVIPLSESELMQKIRESLTIDGKEAEAIKPVPLPGWDGIYTGTLKDSNKRIFARVVARWIPCSDCHNVFYVYSFDTDGNFLNFVPVSINKYGNQTWDAADAAKVQNHLHGESLLQVVPFSPEVDAVTTATISTEVIYDSIGDSKRLIDALTRNGYFSSRP